MRLCLIPLAMLLSDPPTPPVSPSESLFEKNACGPICLVGVAEYLDRPDLMDRIFEILPPSGQPRTLHDLKVAADELGFKTAAVRWPRDEFPKLQSPAIIRLDSSADRPIGHFVVLLESSAGRVLLLDLPGRPTWVSRDQLWRHWDGIAIHVAHSSDQLPRTHSRAVRWLVACAAIGLGFAALFLLALPRAACFQRKTDKTARGLSSNQATPAVSNRLVLSAVSAATVFGIVVWAAPMFWPSTRADDRPPLEFSPEFHMIKRSDRNANQDGRITAAYTIRNNTAHEAIISEVATSCGCATPRLSADTIPPHDEIELRVEVQPAQEANQTFQIHVEFSQPENAILELPGMIVSR